MPFIYRALSFAILNTLVTACSAPPPPPIVDGGANCGDDAGEDACSHCADELRPPFAPAPLCDGVVDGVSSATVHKVLLTCLCEGDCAAACAGSCGPGMVFDLAAATMSCQTCGGASPGGCGGLLGLCELDPAH